MIGTIAAVAGVAYLALWLLYIARRLLAQQRACEALFPHPAE